MKPFIQIIDFLHEDAYKAVEPLTDDEINWRQPHLTNTVGILLRHIPGSERYWMLEVVGGRTIQRKRDEEFGRERLQKAPLVENLRRAQAEVKEVLEGLSAQRLLDEVEQTFRDLPVKVTKSWAILHSIQHTAYHLGQIQLFCKMATSGLPSNSDAVGEQRHRGRRARPPAPRDVNTLLHDDDTFHAFRLVDAAEVLVSSSPGESKVE